MWDVATKNAGFFFRPSSSYNFFSKSYTVRQQHVTGKSMKLDIIDWNWFIFFFWKRKKCILNRGQPLSKAMIYVFDSMFMPNSWSSWESLEINLGKCFILKPSKHDHIWNFIELFLQNWPFICDYYLKLLILNEKLTPKWNFRDTQSFLMFQFDFNPLIPHFYGFFLKQSLSFSWNSFRMKNRYLILKNFDSKCKNITPVPSF